ncbi:hypothetical protein [Streptomyces sp. NPDC053560]|uniref:hypothetical protein n=1 Tax=Streptomyces sp. NPDC053560 TaxID=3365711 RepID=UPI0037CCF7DF
MLRTAIGEQGHERVTFAATNRIGGACSLTVTHAAGGPSAHLHDARASAVLLRYPQAMPYRVSHPNIFGGTIAGLLAAVILIGAIALTTLNP